MVARKIGLDIGDKTIGVALSDLLGMTAQGLTVIKRIGIRKDADKVIALCIENECDTIVVGLNKKLDGSNSIQTEKVTEFKTMLENKLRSNKLAHIKVVFQDERLSTVEANRILIEADLSRSKRKEVIDKQAAIIILQRYLDENSISRL